VRDSSWAALPPPQQDLHPESADEREWLQRIGEWAAETATGDRAEIEDLPDDTPLWSELTANAEQCLGRECPRYGDCFVTRMRETAADASVVVVNHHLLCADASVRQGGFGEVIPDCDLAVIDEAVYGVKADNTPDPIRHFYRRERVLVEREHRHRAVGLHQLHELVEVTAFGGVEMLGILRIAQKRQRDLELHCSPPKRRRRYALPAHSIKPSFPQK